jgi:hypothetical protein
MSGKNPSKSFINSKESVRLYALFSFTFADCPFPKLTGFQSILAKSPELFSL